MESLAHATSTTDEKGSHRRSTSRNSQSNGSGSTWVSPGTQIIICVALLILPLLAFSGALFGVVIRHNVRRSIAEPLIPSVEDAFRNDFGALFINFDATRLTTIASWASSIGPFLPAVIMTLLAFRIATMIQKASENEEVENLPTPKQVALLIRLIDGGTKGMWRTIMYLNNSWRGRLRENCPAVLRTATTVSAISFLFV
jgi:hypothetical protein